MQLQQLASFNALALGQRASAQIPSYAQSLAKINLQIDGAVLTKATIDEIVVKIGARTVFGPVSGSHLDTIMKYRGQYDHAEFLDVDFTERDARETPLAHVGAIDLPALGGEPVFVEVVNSAGAGTPGLSGVVGFTKRQFLDKDGDNRPTRQEQLMHKLLRYSLPTSGTRIVWQPSFRNALIKRIHFFYTGADWGASANGNLHTVECKLNGRAVHDRVECLANRFHQQEHGKVPQSRVYTLDFVADNDFTTALNTRRAKSLEFTLDMTAADTITAYAEVLDVPFNL